MHAPSLLDVLIRLAGSPRLPAIEVRASRYSANVADYNSLTYLPHALEHLAYRVAILPEVRFRRDSFRYKVICANGATCRPAAKRFRLLSRASHTGGYVAMKLLNTVQSQGARR
jgi:hypothetical protein